MKTPRCARCLRCRDTVKKTRDTEAEDPSGCPAILPSSCGAVRAQMSSHHDEAAVPKVLVSAGASAQQARALPTGGGSVTQAHDNLLLAVLSLQGISDEEDEEEDVGRHRTKEKEKKVKEKAKEKGKKKKRAGGFIDDAAEEVRCRACQAWDISRMPQPLSEAGAACAALYFWPSSLSCRVCVAAAAGGRGGARRAQALQGLCLHR